METIFVQIASYRDPELTKTIKDCLLKATYPERLSFGICFQYEDYKELSEYADDHRFLIRSFPWQSARGVGYARHICNSLYRDEDFTLQIDSHHRFAVGWDEILIEQWKRCNHPKAVISGYPPGYVYDSKDNEIYNQLPPMTMVVKGFDHGFIPTFKSWHIYNTSMVSSPFRGSFIAAGFLFTVGNVCKEVPYAKEIYFTGEEILHSIRLFTYGYRIYYPHIWCIWHLYERKTSSRHWSDFQTEDRKLELSKIQDISMDFLHNALYGKNLSIFGNINTLQEFEAYAGVDIKNHIIHPGQLQGYEPPYEVLDGWQDNIKPFKNITVDVKLDITWIDLNKDYTFFYFGFHDINNNELYRIDIPCTRLKYIGSDYHFSASLLVREMPITYTVWLYSDSKQWQEKRVYQVQKESITIL